MIDTANPTLEHPAPATATTRARRCRAGGRRCRRASALVMLVALAGVGGAVRAEPEARAPRPSRSAPGGPCRCGCCGPIAAISDFVPLSSRDRRRDAPGLGRDPNAAPGGAIDVPDPRTFPTLDPASRPRRSPTSPWSKDSKIRRPDADERAARRRRRRLARGRSRRLPRARVPPGPRARVPPGPHLDGARPASTTSTGSTAMRQIENGFSARPGDRDDRRQRQPEPAVPRRPDGRGDRLVRVAPGLRGSGRGVHAHRGRRWRPRGVGGPADRAAQGAVGRDAAPERHLRARRRRHPQRASTSTRGTGSPRATASTRRSTGKAARPS